MAPAKVLHGAVRLHGLTSPPTPDTQVRVALRVRQQLTCQVDDKHCRHINREFDFDHPRIPVLVVKLIEAKRSTSATQLLIG